MGDVKIRALNGASFQINEGEFAVVLGPSGAGKSTILNILGGMDTCTTGETTLSLLIYHKPNFQICILNQDIADKHLTFKSHKII